MKHLEVGYTDVLEMPTNERRFYLGLLLRDKHKREEQEEMQREQSTVTNGKGSRTRKVSGNMLKNQLKSGEIPNE